MADDHTHRYVLVLTVDNGNTVTKYYECNVNGCNDGYNTTSKK